MRKNQYCVFVAIHCVGARTPQTELLCFALNVIIGRIVLSHERRLCAIYVIVFRVCLLILILLDSIESELAVKCRSVSY